MLQNATAMCRRHCAAFLFIHETVCIIKSDGPQSSKKRGKDKEKGKYNFKSTIPVCRIRLELCWGRVKPFKGKRINMSKKKAICVTCLSLSCSRTRPLCPDRRYAIIKWFTVSSRGSITSQNEWSRTDVA